MRLRPPAPTPDNTSHRATPTHPPTPCIGRPVHHARPGSAGLPRLNTPAAPCHPPSPPSSSLAGARATVRSSSFGRGGISCSSFGRGGISCSGQAAKLQQQLLRKVRLHARPDAQTLDQLRTWLAPQAHSLDPGMHARAVAHWARCGQHSTSVCGGRLPVQEEGVGCAEGVASALPHHAQDLSSPLAHDHEAARRPQVARSRSRSRSPGSRVGRRRAPRGRDEDDGCRPGMIVHMGPSASRDQGMGRRHASRGRDGGDGSRPGMTVPSSGRDRVEGVSRSGGSTRSGASDRGGPWSAAAVSRAAVQRGRDGGGAWGARSTSVRDLSSSFRDFVDRALSR